MFECARVILREGGVVNDDMSKFTFLIAKTSYQKSRIFPQCKSKYTILMLKFIAAAARRTIAIVKPFFITQQISSRP